MPPKEKNKVKQAPKSAKYYAFFDAEYTCFMNYDTKFDRNHSNEVISVGIVICDQNFNLLEEYYTPVCPKYNPILTKYCKELTGLKQSEIFAAPSFDLVLQDIDVLLQQYPVNAIYVWGNDRVTIEAGIRKNHPLLSKRLRRNITKITDITKKVTERAFGHPMTVSLSDMKYVCGMEHKTAHNALEDAKDLYMITKDIVKGHYSEERVRKLERYIGQRDAYHRFRRFRKLWPLDEEPRKKSRTFKSASEKYIKELKDFYTQNGEEIPTAILALCDDIRNLSGMDARDCPKLIEK
ncbi:MAG: exonuclease domain-containing protein [Eubacteriales bacterium]|nr:exonuclease domain-containing protein [Eubacteriales bacterium]